MRREIQWESRGVDHVAKTCVVEYSFFMIPLSVKLYVIKVQKMFKKLLIFVPLT